MNLYHSLDQDPELDLLNQVMATFEGDFTIPNIHQSQSFTQKPRNYPYPYILTM